MAEHLIEQLGGPNALAKELGLEANVVYNWRKRGIPWRWRPRIAAYAREKRKSAALPADFLSPEVC